MILVIFDQQVIPIPPVKFRVSGPFFQEKKFKIDFQDSNCGGHLVFPIVTIFAIIDLQVILMLSTKFRINWPFGSGEEAQNRFPR